MNAIIDTNALIDGLNPFDYEKIYLVATTAEELDSLKRNKDKDLARSAKDAIKRLKEAQESGIVEFRYSWSGAFPLDVSIPDNRILAFANDITAFDKEAVLVSADHNVILKARCLDIPCEYYACDDYCGINSYNGYVEVCLTQSEIADFYQSKNNIWGLIHNQYLIIQNESGDIVDKYKWTSDKGFVDVYKKAFDSSILGKFKAKDAYQYCAMDSITNNDLTVLTGPAGTAKTLSALSYAMQELQNQNLKRCIICFNQATLKGATEIGFLPGNSNEKLLSSSLGTILSSKFGDIMMVTQLMAQGKLMLVPMSAIRGTEFGEGDLIFVTEGQNTTPYLLKTLLQRAKDGCKIIIDGDIDEQVDLNYCNGRNNGMRRVIEVFAGEKCFGTVKLKNIYRGEIANIAQRM